MNKKLLALYGLKWNPFAPELPDESLLVTAPIESFCWRIEHGLLREGGFALVAGDPGMGKSVALRVLAERLSRQGSDLVVGVFENPRSSLADFYRQLGDLFEVPLKPHNRWGGFKALRERWTTHVESNMIRPVLIIDEAQEMSPQVLSELRLLTSTHFDSRLILSVILAGDGRFLSMLGEKMLWPLASRIRVRLAMKAATRDELLACLKHLLKAAGNASLMTQELMNALCDHALGNYRSLTTMANELLAVAAQREQAKIDEKLYFEVFHPQPKRAKKTPRRR